LEKKISKLYTYSAAQEKCPIFFENMNVKKLRDLKEVLDSLKNVSSVYQGIDKLQNLIKAERLVGLTTFAPKEKGLVPEFATKLHYFQNIIEWNKLGKGKDDDQIPEPNVGVDQNYDDAKIEIKNIMKELDNQLVHWQEAFKDKRICFVHKKYVISIKALMLQ